MRSKTRGRRIGGRSLAVSKADYQTIRHTLLLTVVSSILVTLGCANAPEPTSALNFAGAPIIVIDVDTLRADHLGCYGYRRPTSPHIDAFAGESVVFEYAFSQAPNTPPSQTSILTSLYPSTHGMLGDGDVVPDEVVTLAEALREFGYTTRGFHDGGYMRDIFNIGQGFEVYEDGRGRGLAWIVPQADVWLRQNHNNGPFLLFIHTYDTHTPYAPPAPFDTMFMEGVPTPSPGFIPNPEQMEAVRRSLHTTSGKKLPDNDIEYAKALYDGEIRYVDTWFGGFMDRVRDLGLDTKAIIVFISDHGEEFQEHGSVLHEKLYATVTRIPFMIRLPGGMNAARVSGVVESIDLMPTVLELVGAPLPSGIQGRSLRGLMGGVGDHEERAAFSESPFFGQRRAVTLDEYRLLMTLSTGACELYRYRADPLEQTNIADEAPEKVEELRTLLDEWRAMVEADRRGKSSGQAIDAETEEQLRRLGYIQ